MHISINITLILLFLFRKRRINRKIGKYHHWMLKLRNELLSLKQEFLKKSYLLSFIRSCLKRFSKRVFLWKLKLTAVE